MSWGRHQAPSAQGRRPVQRSSKPTLHKLVAAVRHRLTKAQLVKRTSASDILKIVRLCLKLCMAKMMENKFHVKWNKESKQTKNAICIHLRATTICKWSSVLSYYIVLAACLRTHPTCSFMTEKAWSIWGRGVSKSFLSCHDHSKFTQEWVLDFSPDGLQLT